MIEHEIKLAAEPGIVLPDLADAVPGLSVGRTTTLRLDAVYYDTPALSLARAGVTMRSRTGESGPIWTLKLPTGKAAGGLSRSEYTFDEPLGPVPAAAFRAARAYIRSQTFGPVLQLHTNRTEVPLEFDGRPLLTLCDDVVVADVPNQPPTTFREVELELAGDDVSTEAIDRLVKAMRAAGCRDDDPIPKAARALGYRGLVLPTSIPCPSASVRLPGPLYATRSQTPSPSCSRIMPVSGSEMTMKTSTSFASPPAGSGPICTHLDNCSINVAPLGSATS